MRRHGNLFDQIANAEALMAAYERARQGKRNHRACFHFARRLGVNIRALERELRSGTYRPRPSNRFWVTDGRKPRLIEAPAFRDLVVQHAASAVVAPLFERRYIATSFACRPGKGTHAAADWLQSAMRRAPRDAWILHVDVRKFFYSIDRGILSAIVRRTIKCSRTLDLLDDCAWRDEPAGIPIGNLMSQTFANVYLNCVDQFAKRTLLVADYGRYMDDMIMIAPDRETGQLWLSRICELLALLELQISHHSLRPIRRGANFVGFRTWRRARFARPHVIVGLRRAAYRGDMPGVVSRLAHVKRSASFRPLMTYLSEKHHGLYRQLPPSFHALHDH